jgi:hypothetical protein
MAAIGSGGGGGSAPKRVVRKPKPPTARQVHNAQAQAAGYASQGRAVEHAARQQQQRKLKQVAQNVPIAQAPLAAKPPRKLKHVHVAPAAAPKPPQRGLHLKQGYKLGVPDKHGDRPIIDPKGKHVAVSQHMRSGGGTVANLPSPVAATLHLVAPAATKALKAVHAPKLVQNIPADAAEIAVTTPSSLAKVGVTAATHPKKLPGMVAAPYKQLVKDPGKFITEHPVSSALMIAPVVRGPGLAAGRVARLAGKQTLARPSATLANTALQEARTGSRSVLKRAVQARNDASQGGTSMTAADLQKRVDEFHDFSKQKTRQMQAGGAREASDEARAQGLPKAARKAAMKERAKGARGGAKNVINRRFAHEFGSTHEVTPEGVVRATNATKGTIHDTQASAQQVADTLNAQRQTIPRGGHGLHQPRRNVPTDVEYTVRDAGGGQFAVVPKIAAERLVKHGAVGSSQAIGAKVLRTAGRSFRGAVLPVSARWLFGQGGEAGIRAGVAGAGPFDAMRFNRVVDDMNRARPGAGDEFAMRVHGGQFDLTGTAREFADGRTLAEEFKGTAFEDVAHGMTKAANVKPVRAVRKGFASYSNVVFNVVNGRIETIARKAMAGQAIRQGKLMEGHVLGLTDKAIADAARGLRGTDAQVELARAVDRMYGKYQKFSPEMRETLLHSTPFYPWYRNVATFLTKTLPVDHPLKAALVADLDATTEEWRKAHGLSLRGGGTRPGFLLGTYPVGKGNQVVPVGRYTPFAPGEPLQSLADLVTPQFGNAKMILHGIDWTGRKIDPKHIPLQLLDSLVEAHVPGAGQLGRITGITPHYVQGKRNAPSVFQGKRILHGVARELNPLAATRNTADAPTGSSTSGPVVKVKPVKVKAVKVRPVRVKRVRIK